MGKKLQKLDQGGRTVNEDYLFACPGCDEIHWVRVKGDPCWKWNGSLDMPTFEPSLKVSMPNKGICHFILTDGVADFCNDCTHENRGRKLELPDWDTWKSGI